MVLDSVVGSHTIECWGVDSSRKLVLTDDDSDCLPDAVINVYGSGRTVVLCPYMDDDGRSCNAAEREDRGRCPYVRRD